MSRSQRLLQLMQVLRAHRAPVAGAALAREIGVSLRTLYRDIATLQAHGATIEGEAGVGYVLRPLMLTEEELEALVLGARWVARHTDERLARAARDAVAKIGAVLPPELRLSLESNALLVARPEAAAPGADLALLREAIREERKLRLRYRDGQGRATRRLVWPFALGFFERTRMLAAWCETRREFRHFRADRIESAELQADRYPQRRQALMRQWRQQEGIEAPAL
ncbi:helix-turn-helix transcriptional regulator [Ramlibacter humi]|uniref:YafY family transcriptional regulator n=1 Tax=Ramlibacter humi TaxID=2530451 RepID=A0A4Z0BV03_9BURK|nr:YafY family protein [Ramlibacter humi]TFZ01819.1 YafY family transcriptional regulator [Ramlibacter humi]